MARPLELTPEVQRIICDHLSAAMTIPVACSAAGVSESAYHEWRGRAPEGEPFAGFLEATTAARLRGRKRLELTVVKAATSDWRAAIAVLERQYRDDWSKRTEVSGPDGGAVQAQVQVQVVWSDALGAACAGEGGDG